MGYGICNCVRPPSTGVCQGCGIDFTPTPTRAEYGRAGDSQPLHGLSAEEVRKIIREEIEQVFRTAPRAA